MIFAHCERKGDLVHLFNVTWVITMNAFLGIFSDYYRLFWANFKKIFSGENPLLTLARDWLIIHFCSNILRLFKNQLETIITCRLGCLNIPSNKTETLIDCFWILMNWLSNWPFFNMNYELQKCQAAVIWQITHNTLNEIFQN